MHFSYATVLALASVSTLVSAYPAGNKAVNSSPTAVDKRNANANAEANAGAASSPLGQLDSELSSLLGNLRSESSPRFLLYSHHPLRPKQY